MNFLYWVYINVFRCARTLHKLILPDQIRVIQADTANWMGVDAMMSDGSTIDVTECVRDTFRHDVVLTPQILEGATRLDSVEGWYYLTKTLEYNKIPTEGVVNGL